MKLHVFLAIAVLSLARPVHGQTREPSLIDSSFETESTSDSIERRSVFLNYFSSRRDPLWAFPEEKAEAFDLLANAQLHNGSNTATHYSGAQLQMGGGWRQSTSHYLSLRAGAHSVNQEASSTSSALGTYRAETYLIPNDALSLHVLFKRDYVYQEMLQPAGVSDFLSALTSSLRVAWRPAEKIRVLSQNSFRSLSDANELQAYDLAGMYGLSTAKNWIWIGLGSEARFSRETRSGYWSPRRFFSIGPRFEAAIPIKEKWALSTGLNVNLSRENSGDWGTGYYASFGGSYGTRDVRLFKVEGILAQSLQSQSTWTSHGARLSWMGSF